MAKRYSIRGDIPRARLLVFDFWYFEPIRSLTATFAFPVAVIMRFLPHLPGTFIRRRRATGAASPPDPRTGRR